MATLLVHGGPVFTPFETIEDGAVFARDGVIERVGTRTEVAGPADLAVDAGGRLICPGFVDLQVNGGGGAMLTEEPSLEALERMARAHVRFGTTSMLATVVTADEGRIVEALAAVREATARPPAGARILGSHLEGPFISPVRRGAHPERFLQPPRRDLLERFLSAAGGSLRLLTLAPELPGALELVRAAREASVVVAVGHTNATYDETMKAFDADASLATHLFNAMRPLHHREPGVVGAVLRSDWVVAGLIADDVHVNHVLLDLAFRSKAADGIALVTDAMPAVGTDVTSFRLLGTEVTVRNGACYLADGTLAGSALSMNRGVATMRDFTVADLDECVRMATATPAGVLGLQDEIGVLKPGARADVVVCDTELNVWKVVVGGELAYEADAA